jgi:SAM-dependent methyltransferase
MSTQDRDRDAADRVRHLIANGPDVNMGGRFGTMTRVARRMIGRAVLYERHYHHQIDLALLETIEDVAHNADMDRRNAAQEVAALQVRLASIEGRISEVAGRLTDHSTRLGELVGRIADVDTRSAVTAGLAENATESADRVGEDLSAMRPAITSLQDRFTAIAREAEALVAAVDAARVDGEKARFLFDDLTAAPYMADEKMFHGVDERGRRTLAFTNGPGSSAVYPGFEDIFRGPTSFVLERQAVYVDLLREHAPVLDLGCGRGEMLELLGEAGIPARGVDLDLEMVERARAGGARVEHGDALAYLAKEADQSLGAVFSAQFIEHIPQDRLPELIELSVAKLEPGGVFIAETVNPHSPRALKSFWVDPTHQHPLFPETMLALCQLSGFDAAEVVFPAGSNDLETDLRTCGEYAIVATRRRSE